MRSVYGLPGWLSTVISCLSSRKFPAPAVSSRVATGRPGKLNDAPLLPVERNTNSPLDWSGFGDAPAPRLNAWHDKYALPLVSHATDVSPPPCQYSRAAPTKSPRTNPFGVVVSAQVRPRLSE